MIEVKKFITYKEAAKLEAEGRGTIGGLGGFFQKGMRWKDYLDCFYPKGQEYAEALRRYIVKNKIKRDRKSTRLNSSHSAKSRMPSSA